jgi:hypothetical protein
MVKGQQLAGLGYNNLSIVKPISRGATAFYQVYGDFPLATHMGFTIPGFPRGAPALTPTLRTLFAAALPPGALFTSPAAGQPLTVNPYATQ